MTMSTCKHFSKCGKTSAYQCRICYGNRVSDCPKCIKIEVTNRLTALHLIGILEKNDIKYKECVEYFRIKITKLKAKKLGIIGVINDKHTKIC